MPGSRGRIVEALALQEEMDLREGGALELVAAPALAHEVVHVARTPGRAVHALEQPVVRLQVRQVLQHLRNMYLVTTRSTSH